jgi:hypothetical protein
MKMKAKPRADSLQQFGQKNSRQVTGRGPDTWHTSGDKQRARFARRASAYIIPGEPLDTLLSVFSLLLHLLCCLLRFGEKPEIEYSFGGMIVNAKPPDPHKAFGHHVQAKPPEELHARQGYLLMAGIVPVIFGQKGNMCVSNPDNPVVADGNAVGVLAQVPDHMLCPGHRPYA